MRAAEKGFLLLSSTLGDPLRRPLSTAQLGVLSQRVRQAQLPAESRDLALRDLTALGYSLEMARRILGLLSEEDVLEYYLQKGRKLGCVPLTRVSPGYPAVLKQRLGLECPGVLWAKGDLSLLEAPRIALVGSRDLKEPNRAFTSEAGRQAAMQGYPLVSGNARGADRTAQDACLQHGGRVISVVADELFRQPSREHILYLSEDNFDLPFSPQRALSRNRVIHALPEKTLVAQCALESGGTWAGTIKNLRFGWSPVFCFADGSDAMLRLEQMGAALIRPEQLRSLKSLRSQHLTLFDQSLL